MTLSERMTLQVPFSSIRPVSVSLNRVSSDRIVPQIAEADEEKIAVIRDLNVFFSIVPVPVLDGDSAGGPGNAQNDAFVVIPVTGDDALPLPVLIALLAGAAAALLAFRSRRR